VHDLVGGQLVAPDARAGVDSGWRYGPGRTCAARGDDEAVASEARPDAWAACHRCTPGHLSVGGAAGPDRGLGWSCAGRLCCGSELCIVL